MLEIGQMAPDFTLTSDEGQEVSLSDLRGQHVILFFYPRAATPGCTRQACGFRDNWPQIEAAGATVFGISPDSPETLAEWREDENLPYHLLSDPEGEVARQYEVWGEKKLFGRVYEGVIRSHFVVDSEGRLADIQRDVSPEQSVERAVEAL